MTRPAKRLLLAISWAIVAVTPDVKVQGSDPQRAAPPGPGFREIYISPALPPDASTYLDVPAPSLQPMPNDGYAQVTLAPWVQSNGWRFMRGLHKARYAAIPRTVAPLAAAEAFAFNVDAILYPDPADAADLGKMIEFLKANAQPPMPALANIGVVDDGSPAMGEALNMLIRRNLLFKVVKRPERGLDLTVEVGTKDFPKESLANPGDFAARVREKLTDDKRLVRVFGTNTVVARLTGDGKRARLVLVAYGRNRTMQDIRVAVRGQYQPAAFALYGAPADTRLLDVLQAGQFTEFTIPVSNTVAIVDLQVPVTMTSARAGRDFELTANPQAPEWRTAPRVEIGTDYFGKAIAGAPTTVRSRWTDKYLYLLYECPYDELNLRPNPNPAAETPQLWNNDVAEVFIGWDFEHIGRYKELQVSPQSEWVDLDIDRANPRTQAGMRWNSGYSVKGRIDAAKKVWYGEMRIPFSAIDERTTPLAGREFRIGLYRIAGNEPRKYYAWSPTGQANFHVPAAFGRLILR